MDVDTAFPALNRAKQRFLLRKEGRKQPYCAVAKKNPVKNEDCLPATSTSPASSTRIQSSAADGILQAIYVHLNEDLKLLNEELHVMRQSVKRELKAVVVETDRFASVVMNSCQSELVRLSNGQSFDRIHTKRRQKTIRVRRLRHPMKIIIAAQHAKKTFPSGKASKLAQPLCKTIQQAKISPLMQREVGAYVIQSHFRRYLYGRLYRRGSEHFLHVKQFTFRYCLSYRWYQWRRFVAIKRRRRLRWTKKSMILQRDCHEWSASRAEQVRLTDGKYAVAKEYHNGKLMAQAFCGWISGVVSKAKATEISALHVYEQI